MTRKLAFALSLLGVCFTGLVHALGLGEATVNSSLNQPLRAEIELVNTKNLELNEVLPGLATREEFLKANVDRVYFLSDIRFKVESNENGQMVVVLTTSKPVREPFINFLVEVIWPSGRLLREYALLIDPPLFNEDKARPVQAPVTYQQAGGDVVSIPESPVSVAPAPSQSVASTQTGQGIAGQSYGATKSSDTLWDIALKARPDRSVSPQQVMLSIQDINPSAFIDQNINKLKAGVVLRLPTLEQIKQRSSFQAINEVIAQNEALLPKRTQSVASAVKKAPANQSATGSASGDELKLVVANNQSPTATSSANSGESSSSGTGQSATSKELAVTLEKLDKATIENNELSGRVGDLEEQLQTLQRLLTLKNDQLATIQEQLRANELAELQAETAASGPAVTDLAQESQAESDVEKQVDDATAQSEPMPAPAVSVVEESKQKPEAPASAAADSDSLIEAVINNPLYLGLVGLGAILLLVLLWLVSRSNARKEQEFHARSQEGDVAHESEEQSAFNDEENLLDGSETLEDESQESESVTDDEADESDEEEAEAQDVIAEADVYVAYGRLDQAANILEEAISAEPVRTDYRLKLLDVYKESNDIDAFNRQFSELEAIQDEDAIEAATQIRNELLDSDLLAIESKETELIDHREDEQAHDQGRQDASLELEQAALDSEESDSATLTEEGEQRGEDSRTFDFDTVDELEEEELGIDFDSDELDLELDVDLDLDLEEPESVSEEPAESAQTEDDLELDISSLEAVEEASLSPEEEASLVSPDALSLDDDEIDAELNDVDFSAPLDQESEIDLPEDLDLDSVDELDELDEPAVEIDSEADVLSEESVDTDEPGVQAGEEAPELVVSDDILDEAVEAFGAGDDLDADLSDSEDFDFLEGADEASTKLDLARAYIDMGDIDGARDILEEVEKEGSSAQQSEAKELLNSLD